MVVFEAGSEVDIATWSNVIKLVSKIYPGVSEKIYRQLENLRTTKFETIEEAAGFDFSEVDKAGKADPWFITYDKYKKSPESLVAIRAFLYFTVHLRELFSGHGSTYTGDGKKGLMEYIVPNKRISDLGPHKIIDIHF
ncbi:MAG: hypothetical protein ACFFAS_17235 [Promethearchaeota archaeon]